MPKRKTRFVRDNYYHIYNRGANRQSIFADDEDFVDFLQRLKKFVQNSMVQTIAYCLLPNHFHLLVRQDADIEAGLAVQYTCNGYAQRFNARHQRQGTIFQGRYRAEQISQRDHLRHLCRYIHVNPVRHGLATSPELWPYSNYLDWIGRRDGTLVDRDFLTGQFGNVAAYIRFVTSYLVRTSNIPTALQIYLNELEM